MHASRLRGSLLISLLCLGVNSRRRGRWHAQDPPPSPSPSILCCFYLPITYVHSLPLSKSFLYCILTFCIPHPFRVHSCASCSPDQKKRGKREELEEGSLRCDLSQRDRGGRTIIGSKEREITDVEVFLKRPVQSRINRYVASGCNLLYSWFHCKLSTKHLPTVIFLLETIKLERLLPQSLFC